MSGGRKGGPSGRRGSLPKHTVLAAWTCSCLLGDRRSCLSLWDVTALWPGSSTEARDGIVRRVLAAKADVAASIQMFRDLFRLGE